MGRSDTKKKNDGAVVTRFTPIKLQYRRYLQNFIGKFSAGVPVKSTAHSEVRCLQISDVA
jgi:hypothetical protein